MRDRRYELLNREAALASNSLGSGLTSLRQAAFNDKGKFYGALFALSIGIERIAKIIILLDHEVREGVFPNNAFLKSLGHQLNPLISKLREIAKTKAPKVDGSLLDDEIVASIQNNLHSFAVQARYYNLDTLTMGNRTSDLEPLARWDAEVSTRILARHPPRPSKKSAGALALSRLLDGDEIGSVLHTSESGSPITSFEQMTTAALQAQTKQKYSVLYTWQIIQFCYQLLVEVEHQLPQGSFLYEHFVVFAERDRQATLKRKKWVI